MHWVVSQKSDTLYLFPWEQLIRCVSGANTIADSLKRSIQCSLNQRNNVLTHCQKILIDGIVDCIAKQFVAIE